VLNAATSLEVTQIIDPAKELRSFAELDQNAYVANRLHEGKGWRGDVSGRGA
jgi:hypothetical protein